MGKKAMEKEYEKLTEVKVKMLQRQEKYKTAEEAILDFSQRYYNELEVMEAIQTKQKLDGRRLPWDPTNMHRQRYSDLKTLRSQYIKMLTKRAKEKQFEKAALEE